MSSLKALGVVVAVVVVLTMLQTARLLVNSDHVLFRATLEVENTINLPHHISKTQNENLSLFTGTNYEPKFDEQTESDENSTSTYPDSSSVVFIRPKEAFLWKGAQSRLCKRIKREEQRLKKRNETNVKLHLYLQVPCKQVHERNQHGNFLLGFYGMKLAALHFQSDFTFQCYENAVEKGTSDEGGRFLLWWLQNNPAVGGISNRPVIDWNINKTLYSPPYPSENDTCEVRHNFADCP
jgi:hypothetical protein